MNNYRARSPKGIVPFLSGFAAPLVLAAALAYGGGVLTAPPSAAARSARASGFVPAHSRAIVSSIRHAAQFFLVQNRAATLAARRQLRSVAPSIASPLSFTAPGGALAFNSDSGAFTQNEESIAIDPTTPGGSAPGTLTVGGFNDFRGFFLPNNTLSGFAVSSMLPCDESLSHPSCAHLLTDGWIPGVVDPLCTDGSVLAAGGDPALAATSDGTFLYATLALATGSGCAFLNNHSGIIISVSLPQLKSGGCVSNLTTNTCWQSFLIDESSTVMQDKEWIAVDPVSGQITVAWDDVNGNFAYLMYRTCTLTAGPNLSCGVRTQAPCATTCNNVFGPYLAIWHNPNSGVNNVVLTYDQFKDFFPCPPANGSCLITELHMSNLTTGIDQVFTTLQPSATLLAPGNNDGYEAIASSQYRIATQVKVAADAVGVATPYIYVTYDYCPAAGSDGHGAAAYYDWFLNANLVGQGSCVTPQVAVDRFSDTSGTPTAMAVPSGYDQTMPSVAVDEAGTSAGTVTLAYNSTNDDPQHAGLRVYVAQAAAGSTIFGTPITNVVTADNAYTADPGISYGEAPEYGDYIQVAVQNGAVFVHFTSNYEQKTGPAVLGTVPVNQEDNYLCFFIPGVPVAGRPLCRSS
jgi:hypothetical protein